MPTPTPPNQYEKVTGLSTVKAFGADVPVPENAAVVLLQAETANVRFTCDGSNPDASTGMILVAGEAPIMIDSRAAVRTLRVYDSTNTAVLHVQFLGNG